MEGQGGLVSSLVTHRTHMGGCQNYVPFLGTLEIRCRIKIGIRKGTIILTTTHIVALIIPVMNLFTKSP